MEYSPTTPSLTFLKSTRDHRSIRSFHVEVVSSASFLQYYTCVLDEEQLQSHLEATQFLDKVVGDAWDKLQHRYEAELLSTSTK